MTIKTKLKHEQSFHSWLPKVIEYFFGRKSASYKIILTKPLKARKTQVLALAPKVGNTGIDNHYKQTLLLSSRFLKMDSTVIVLLVLLSSNSCTSWKYGVRYKFKEFVSNGCFCECSLKGGFVPLIHPEYYIQFYIEYNPHPKIQKRSDGLGLEIFMRGNVDLHMLNLAMSESEEFQKKLCSYHIVFASLLTRNAPISCKKDWTNYWK